MLLLLLLLLPLPVSVNSFGSSSALGSVSSPLQFYLPTRRVTIITAASATTAVTVLCSTGSGSSRAVTVDLLHLKPEFVPFLRRHRFLCYVIPRITITVAGAVLRDICSAVFATVVAVTVFLAIATRAPAKVVAAAVVASATAFLLCRC